MDELELMQPAVRILVGDMVVLLQEDAPGNANAGGSRAALAGHPTRGRRRADELLGHLDEADGEQPSSRRPKHFVECGVQRPKHLTEPSVKQREQSFLKDGVRLANLYSTDSSEEFQAPVIVKGDRHVVEVGPKTPITLQECRLTGASQVSVAIPRSSARR